MNQEFNFFKTEMPKTRPADFYLGCLNGSVFIDFNRLENDQILLVRISFDGYGCCRPSWEGEPVKISISESRKLIKIIRNDNLAHKTAARILSLYFSSCGKALWIDALKKHELV